MQLDYRVYIIDLNLKKYFKVEFSQWDQIYRSLLDPERRDHREKFLELVEEILNHSKKD